MKCKKFASLLYLHAKYINVILYLENVLVSTFLLSHGSKTVLKYVFLLLLLAFSVTPFKIDQTEKSKPFNRLTPESENRKKIDIQRLSPRFRSQQFFLWEICR